MTRKLVWFEGVDFEECVFDTNDISTIRGASLALLDTPGLIAAELVRRTGNKASVIFAGASQGLFVVTDDQLPLLRQIIADVTSGRAPEARDLPVTALHFVVGEVEMKETDPIGSMRRAQAAARRAQMRGEWVGPRIPVPPSDGPCTIERRRPADTTIPMPKDRASELGIEVGPNAARTDGLVDVPVCSSVKQRRDWGRESRKSFYRKEAKGWWETWSSTFTGHDGLGHFVLDLQEMVEAPEVEKRLPVSLKSKIAVLYADGNGFGKILAGCRSLEEVAAFSAETRALMSKLLGSFLDRMSQIAVGDGDDGSDNPIPRAAAVYEEHGKAPRLRFESLLYGGDEICWVFPAWLALDLVSKLFSTLDGKRISGHAATYSCGLVIADRKMPIADLRALAHEAANLAKIKPKKTEDEKAPPEPTTRIAIQVFESVEPPAHGLAGHRARILGGGEDVRRFLSLDRSDFEELTDWIRKRKVTGVLPRSQILRILRKAHWEGIGKEEEPRRLGSAARERSDSLNADDHVTRAHEDHRQRVGGDTLPNLLRDPFPDEETGGRETTPALDFWIASHLWDYVDPFAVGDE